jgi:signal transduction histidine kinase
MLENPVRDRAAMLACPIQDNRGVLGDLWLISPSFHAFSEQDIRLVQQVANQCAIAIRQARLYQTAQRQVRELERLNSLKDDFLSTVSHELRTPIATIKMAAEMLEVVMSRSGLLSPATRQRYPEIDRYLRVLHDECRREIHLINDILDLSRLEIADSKPALDLSTQSLQQWLPQIAAPFHERMSNQQQCLQLEIATDLPPLTTDFSYLERILVELLNNACKYTPQGERIALSAHWLNPATVLHDSSTFALRSLPAVPAPYPDAAPSGADRLPASLQIAVSNTGVEISQAECDRIFEKFYRIPQNDPWRHGGTGLGLALVKQLVQQLQGTIQVHSADQQTQFLLCLPMAIAST